MKNSLVKTASASFCVVSTRYSRAFLKLQVFPAPDLAIIRKYLYKKYNSFLIY